MAASRGRQEVTEDPTEETGSSCTVGEELLLLLLSAYLVASYGKCAEMPDSFGIPVSPGCCGPALGTPGCCWLVDSESKDPTGKLWNRGFLLPGTLVLGF